MCSAFFCLSKNVLLKAVLLAIDRHGFQQGYLNAVAAVLSWVELSMLGRR